MGTFCDIIQPEAAVTSVSIKLWEVGGHIETCYCSLTNMQSAVCLNKIICASCSGDIIHHLT